MWKQLSDDLKAAAAKASASLGHVGGEGIPGRTAVAWSEGVAVTLAREASDGESVPLLLPSGPAQATVKAWDPRTGLTLLSVPGLKNPSWKLGAKPDIGALVLTVAFPSPQGAEARLDLVRFSGGSSEWGRGVELQALVQTDGSSFPGFTGAAVVDAEGALVGFVAENRSGNGGFVVTAADLSRHVEALLKSGTPKQAWLGVSTRPGGGQGLALVSVDGESPAAKAGWKPGDLLVSLAGTALKDPADLVRVLASLTPGAAVPARLLREGEVHELGVTPGGR